MRWLFWLLGLFAVATGLTLAAHNPGYVQFVYPPWKAELSLSLFAFLLLIGLLLGYLLLRLVFAAAGMPGYVREFRLRRAQEKERAGLMEALTAYFEGRYAKAEKAAVQAMVAGDRTGLGTIIAARSAHEQREFDKRDAYLADAERNATGEPAMRLMAKAEFMLDQKQPQSALHALRELEDTGTHHHLGALGLELKAQQQVQNWDAVLEVTSRLEKRKAIDSLVARQLQQFAWREKLRDPALDMEGLRKLWKSIPTDLRRGSKLAAAAATAFGKLGDCRSAQQVLTDSLNQQWDSGLVSLYGECRFEDNTQQLEQAERWLKTHSGDAGLLLTLGKLCLHQKLWGKAQNYLDASISLQPSSAAWLTLSELAEKLGEHDRALSYFRQATQAEGVALTRKI